jgi:phenylalanine-4-hydroxylase
MDIPVVELDADHPGFRDGDYRARRNHIALLAAEAARTGSPCRVDYTPQENATWAAAFTALFELYPSHACREHRSGFAELGYRREEIPQLAEVSRTLERRTGFRFQAVAGLVSPREFLGTLAERVFCATQYVRHHSRPLYTPEPDVIHELIGHAPMLADPELAELTERLGRASLAANDVQVQQLATLYWFTVEFGLVEEDGGLRAYGAGLLSSFGELQNALAGGAEVRPFSAATAKGVPYPITTYQPILWRVGSIRQAFADLDAWARAEGLVVA